MFSQRARVFILAYHKIQEQLTNSLSTSEFNDIAASPVKVEKLLRQFKTLRCAMDFDITFARLCSLMILRAKQKMIIVIDDHFCDAASELRICIHLLKDSFLSLQKWQYQIVVLIIFYGGVHRLLEVL